MSSAYNLLVPSSVIILPVLSYAVLVEQQWSECLVSHTPGIYKTNTLDPVIPAGTPCFYRGPQVNGTYPLLPLLDFDNHKNDVYDQKGMLLLSKSIMCNKQTCLLTEPVLPVSALKIVKLLVDNFLITKQPHIKHNSCNSKIHRFLKPGYEYLVDEAYLEATCVGLLSQVETFIGKDINHLYFAKLNLFNLVLEKTIDYRIFEWQLMQDKPDEHGYTNEINSFI